MIFLFNLLSFLLPTQLGLHLNLLNQTVFGFKIDYLTPTIYLTDIIIFLIIILNIKKIKVKIVPLLILLSFILINLLISSYKIASLYKWTNVVEMILLGMVIIKNNKINIFNNFVKPLSYSIYIVCILGIAQWLLGKTIGGPFYFLGERSFSLGDPGISSFGLFGVEMLRPYSVFSHPNALAGFLLVFSFFLINFRKRFNYYYYYILSLLILINLFLTFSTNIYITIVILTLFYFNPKLNFALILFDFESRSYLHRIELIKSSLHLIKSNFLTGVGLNNFIPSLVGGSNKFLNAWELQPVHNIYLLVFSETGIIGFVLFTCLIFKSFVISKASKVFSFSLYAILITGLFDHYWLTLHQNILLLTFVLALSLTPKRK